MSISKKARQNIFLLGGLFLVVLLLVDLVIIKNIHQAADLESSAKGVYLSDALTVKDYPSEKTVYVSNVPLTQVFSVSGSNYAATSTGLTWFDSKQSKAVLLPCTGQLSGFGETKTGLVALDTCLGKQFLVTVFSGGLVKSKVVQNVSAVSVDRSGYVVMKNGSSSIGFWLRVPLGKDGSFSSEKAITQYGNLGGFYSSPQKGLFFWGTDLTASKYSAYSFKKKDVEPFTPPTVTGFKQLITFQSAQLSDSSVLWLSTVSVASHPGVYHQQLIEDGLLGSKQFYDLPAAVSEVDGSLTLNSQRTLLGVPVITANGKQSVILFSTATSKIVLVRSTAAFCFTN